MTWVPIPDEEATEQIGIGVHTGLRKGSDATDADELWKAISDSNTGAWSDAVDWAVTALRSMGFRLCKQAGE